MKLTEVTQTKLEKLLAEYNIKKYTIREDGLIDVDGDVNLQREKFTNLPFKFGKVIGDFYCPACPNLTSLEGAPEEVVGNFYCSSCPKLTSLEGAPEEVVGNFYCYNCANLTSLKGASPNVGGYFHCWGCSNLTSLVGAPQRVGGGFICYGCANLTSLKGAPQEVVGYFSCMECYNLTSLEHLPKQIKGKLIINDLPKVKNYLMIFNTKGITEIIHDDEKIANIVNKYIKSRDMLGCQDELIEAGFEEYAEVE